MFKGYRQLGEDDIVDYILLFILIGVALIGFNMWKKVRDQEKSYILWCLVKKLRV